ncbi:MAG: hypothetical protein Q4D04_01845 [Clostridia bacterium]|nr:hypothetical protein [Clostridia bacterium]
MKLDFVKISPAGNTTILITSPVEPRLRAEISAAVMKDDSVAGEQVGFLVKPTRSDAAIRLEMMGGEFCANATMAACAYLARRDGIGDTEKTYGIEVSGCPLPLPAKVRSMDGGYVSRVPMPLPAVFDIIEIRGQSLPVVHLPGISHVIVPRQWSESFAKDDIRNLAGRVHSDAFGLMFYANAQMKPFVYVKSTDTAVWEGACGSGSAAVAAYLSRSEGESRVSISQPGGVVEAFARCEKGDVRFLSISVRSLITVEGKVYI